MKPQQVHIAGSPGQAAYAAWRDEFGHTEDPWHELSRTSQDAWDEIAERVTTDTVVLPPDGFEVTVRASTGTLGFAWSGKAGEAMTKAMLYAVALAAQGCPPPQSTPPLQYDFWRVI